MTGGIGWINDPNGFAPYKGEYHLFFQYYPYDTKWGPMHWDHVKTRAFIRWERLPAALAPDMDYDRDGCFSGGAVELPDGRHLLMYTGVRNIRCRNGMIESFQTQCIAIGDGKEYNELNCNPVIDASLLPEGGSTQDFRDPKIWRDGDSYNDHRMAKSIENSIDFAAKRQVWQRMILKIIRPMLIAMSIWQNSRAVLPRSKAARRKAFLLFAII